MPILSHEIKALRENWKRDPIWDIEDTVGFEEHKVELKDYRLAMEASWAKQNEEHLQKRAAELECSIELAQYIEILEYRLQAVANRLDRLELAYT